MRMSPAILIFGSAAVVWAAFVAVVMIPTYTISRAPSESWRPLTAREERGRQLYIANGCTYCHSQYIRAQDWGIGAERVAQAGDYHDQRPHLLGSERWGPDLSQEGGEHPDDWHLAHFHNPRNTRPLSLMPRFAYLGDRGIADLIVYKQSLGGKDADYRTARQRYWKEQALAAYDRGYAYNAAWLHSKVPDVWRNMPNPYPATTQEIARGLEVYQFWCVSCHGPVGDGQGPAAPHLKPPPFDFTALKGHMPQGRYVGGLLYYQVMNGIVGTAMPYFKKDLESAKIWNVSNYIAASFVGYTDYQVPPLGLDVPYLTPADPQLPYRPPAGLSGPSRGTGPPAGRTPPAGED